MRPFQYTRLVVRLENNEIKSEGMSRELEAERTVDRKEKSYEYP